MIDDTAAPTELGPPAWNQLDTARLSKTREDLESGQSFQEILESARQLESYFISTLLERMRATLPGEGLFGSAPGSNVYEGMFDRAMGEHLAKTGQFGLAETIARQVARQVAQNETLNR